jgi:CTD small phosphatase-like protein 2
MNIKSISPAIENKIYSKAILHKHFLKDKIQNTTNSNIKISENKFIWNKKATEDIKNINNNNDINCIQIKQNIFDTENESYILNDNTTDIEQKNNTGKKLYKRGKINYIPNKIDYSNNNDYFSEAESNIKKSATLNIEELLITEENLTTVLNSLKDYKPCKEECFEWINSYSQSDLIHNLEKFFVNEKFKKIISYSFKFNIFSLILTYVISLDVNFFAQLNIYLFNITVINHKILILISKFLLGKILDKNNIYVEKLKQLIKRFEPLDKNIIQIMRDLSNLLGQLLKLFNLFFNIYPLEELKQVYSQIENLSQIDLIKLYRDKFHININQNGSIFASSDYFLTHQFKTPESVPFLKEKPKKPYTLVLDLDETLIHFKPNPNNDSNGKIMIRPHLYEFLKNIKKYYEIIVFTAATKEYADPIIDAIEKEEKYFDYRLYRNHTNVLENDFVKDISLIGRDLDKIVIVDNMKQNYKLQPNNGITIRPFWGKDVNDTALSDLLWVLQKIAEKKLNIIDGLRLYKEDIISKVSSNIFRRALIV